MPLYSRFIIALWLVFLAYWIAMAFRAKKNIGTGRFWKGIPLRAAIIVLVLLLMRLPALRQALREAHAYVSVASVPLGLAGTLLCALGMGFAVWARVYIADNWGVPMARKEDPELVTGGPYAYVRHPIYTGYIVAMLGSAIGESVLWVVPLLVLGTFFVYSAHNEEKLMLEQLPDQYPSYRR